MTQPDTLRPVPSPVDEDAVAEFLRRHLDFFNRHPRLLADMELHHPADGTVSLVDRQVQLLRTRNEELRGHLNEILANATDNDGTFSRTRTFTLALMDTDGLAALDATLAKHLVAGFEADHAICFVRGTTLQSHGHAFDHLADVAQGAVLPLTRLFELDDPVCNACRPEDYARLFDVSEPDGPCSIAHIPIRAGDPAADAELTAALVIGAKDPHRFAPDMGKVFLFYIADVLARTLIRLGLARGRG